MKALTNFIVDDLNLDTISEAATKKTPKQEKWPNNVDAANKKADELLSQATDVDDIDVTKVVKGKETKNYELVVENKQSAEAMKKLLETKDKQEMINKLTALEELLIESSVDQYESKERIIKR